MYNAKRSRAKFEVGGITLQGLLMIIFTYPFIVCPLENKETMGRWERTHKFHLKIIQPKHKQGTIAWDLRVYFQRKDHPLKTRHLRMQSHHLNPMPPPPKLLYNLVYNSDSSFEIFQLKFPQVPKDRNVWFVWCTYEFTPTSKAFFFLKHKSIALVSSFPAMALRENPTFLTLSQSLPSTTESADWPNENLPNTFHLWFTSCLGLALCLMQELYTNLLNSQSLPQDQKVGDHSLITFCLLH